MYESDRGSTAGAVEQVNVKLHKANELTLLCPNQHRMKTIGLKIGE